MLLASTIKQPLQFSYQELDNTEQHRRLVEAQLHVVRNNRIFLFSSGDKFDSHLFHAAIRERLIDSMNVRRFKDGFLINTFNNRPFIFCHLQILQNVIHPILIPTPFLPLNLPLPQGAPIILLPYATPAYFLAEYTGPTTALISQFQAALHGLGAGPWAPSFIIAWIKVENRQGEDKGLCVIYPADLCVSTPRPPLEYIPELPTPLQPSPQIVPFPRRSFSSPHSLYSFRALTVSKSKDLRQVAAEVSAYVDAVAREREKERERLKRERESASSPKMTRTPAAEPSIPTPIPPPQPVPEPQPQPVAPVAPSIPQQTFYPSPPLLPPPAPLQPAPPMNSYDPYSMDTDSAWPQSNTDYLDMDMNMNFDFNGNTGGMGGGENDHERNFIGLDNFTDFTEDDFSFFDQPKPTPLPLPPPPVPTRIPSPPPVWGTTPSTFILPDGFTPRSIDSVPPDLVASSSPTPETPGDSAPLTPNVHLEPDTPRGPFEPIPFAPYHRQADGKYAVGKFAFSLPSPPAEEDMMARLSLVSSSSSSPVGTPGWRSRYDAVTDPRIGVVKKLIGVKRKTPYKHMIRESSSPPSWMSLSESLKMRQEEEEEEEEMGVEDIDSEDEDEEEEGTDSPMLSRPATPPPSYLPLGPTLLQTEFHHSHLLPLSVPLRPPGASIAPINPTNPATASVPTPVSPAATMGAANERSKSLEAAAFALAAEVVENPVWAETWHTVNFPSSATGAITTTGMTTEVWGVDVRAVAKLLAEVTSFAGLEMKAPLSMEELFGLEEGKQYLPLEDPMVSVGKGATLLDVDVSSLRFWEKLGLGPKSGKKDLGAFVLYDENGAMGSRMEEWFRSVRDVYQAKRFGTMTPGQSTVSKDGLVPLRLDATFRKSLTAFITGLANSPQPTNVVFLVLPITIMSLSSPALRQILTVLRKVLSGGYVKGQLFFQFIPEPHILVAQEKAPAFNSALDQLVASVYNRMRIPVDRLRSKGVQDRLDEKHEFGGFDEFDSGQSLRKNFMAPSFTLARPLESNKVSYVRSKHASLDVLDRHGLLHVAYHITACGRWILACCVDQRGDAYDLRVWLTQRSSPGSSNGDVDMEGAGHGAGESGGGAGSGAGVVGQGSRGSSEVLEDEEYAIKKVWDFGMDFAKQANVEWRVVFARLGVINEKEMSAWSNLLSSNVIPSREQPPLHHSIVCVVPDAPWHFIPSNKDGVAPPFSRQPSNRPSNISSSTSSASPISKQPAIFKDISSATYAIFPTVSMPMSVPPSQNDLGLSNSFVADPSSSSSASSHSNFDTTPPVLPQASSILIHVPHPSTSTPVSMTHIHLLRTAHSASYTHSAQPASSARAPDDKQLLEDVTKNYYALSVLAKARLGLDATPTPGKGLLPFHAAAVERMRLALDKDWDRLEPGVDS